MNEITLKNKRNSLLGEINSSSKTFTATISEFVIEHYSHVILVHNLKVNMKSKERLVGDGHKWVNCPVNLVNLGYQEGDNITFKGYVSKYHNLNGNGFNIEIVGELRKV